MTQSVLKVDFDTWAITSLVFNYIGDALVWGVVVPPDSAVHEQPVDRAAERRCPARHVREADDPVRERSTRAPPLELVLRQRAPLDLDPAVPG